MKYDVDRNDYDSTAAWMIASTIASLIADYELTDPLPLPQEIEGVIDRSAIGNSLNEYIGAAWEAAREIVHDEFPQFNPPEE